eukprot:15055142-Alexandrium_andersonii.AAC.1
MCIRDRISETDDRDRQFLGMRAEDASGPAAREASGPPAPGAHPREGKLACAKPGQYCKAADIVCAWKTVVKHWQRPVMDGRA